MNTFLLLDGSGSVWSWWGLSVSRAGLRRRPGPLMGQPVADYRARRLALWEHLRESVSDDRPLVVAVRGFDTRDREDFEEGRFRQDNWFAYLTGVEIPGAFLILAPEGEGMRSVLYLPKGPLGSRFSGGIQPVPGPGAESEARFGVDEVAINDRVLVDLLSALVAGQEPAGNPSARSFTRSTPVRARMMPRRGPGSRGW